MPPRKGPKALYEAREAVIRNTQVHRIATTVEIVRGLILGERPMSIKATAKERGDILTDQISMVRIWVYPVLAFIVAFLPTLMVEIGFSTVFERDPCQRQRPPHRLGFLGRRLHWLYTRAGRHKDFARRTARPRSLRPDRRTRTRSDRNQGHCGKALAETTAATEKALAEKEAALQAAQATAAAAATAHEEQLKWLQAEHEEQLKQKEDEWVAKFAGLADSLNRAVAEKDALRDLQKDRNRTPGSDAPECLVGSYHAVAPGTGRPTHRQRNGTRRDDEEQQEKLMAVTEDCKTQVIQARRQMADAELAAVETTARCRTN